MFNLKIFTAEFKDLVLGATFRYQNDYYMRTETVVFKEEYHDGTYTPRIINAVNLRTGSLVTIKDDCEVEPIEINATI